MKILTYALMIAALLGLSGCILVPWGWGGGGHGGGERHEEHR